MSDFTLKGRTLDLLRNFSTINQSMVFRPGNSISTLSVGRKVLARATIEETIPDAFAVYDLTRFFRAIDLFSEPKMRIEDKFVLVTEGPKTLSYIIADADNIVHPSEDAIRQLPSVDVEFDITAKMIKACLKAADVMGQPNIVFEGDGSKVIMSTQNIEKPTNEVYAEDVGKFTGGEEPFKIIMKTENLKLIPDDYHVQICFKRIVQFASKDVTYIVAAEQASMVP